MPNPETTERTNSIRMPVHIDAKLFERELTNLVARATKLSATETNVGQRWAEINQDLRTARARVRGLMHSEDRKMLE